MRYTKVLRVMARNYLTLTVTQYGDKSDGEKFDPYDSLMVRQMVTRYPTIR